MVMHTATKVVKNESKNISTLNYTYKVNGDRFMGQLGKFKIGI